MACNVYIAAALVFSYLCVCVCEHVHMYVLACVSHANLDHSEQALVCGGVCVDEEVASGVSSNDAVHSSPGLSMRLVFIRHSQIGNNRIHSVFMNLSKELKR